MNRSALRSYLTRTYLTIDPRSLGLARIALGVVLVIDLLDRVPFVRDFYSNLGLLPNHTLLWRPVLPRLFSVFFPVSLPHEAALTFAICFFCYFCLLIGWRTRLFHVLSFLMATSLHNRVLFAEGWGSMALGALMLWTAFLPLGRRFSVDAVLASLRARPGETPADLTAERLPPPDDRPAVSLAALAVLLQLAVICWFDFAHATGPTWKSGAAVHYLLWQERIVTSLGLWVRVHAPFGLTKALTFGALAAEASAPFLILTPVFWRWTRAVAIVQLAALSLGVALLVNLGSFAGAMLAFCPLLLDGAHWRLLGRLVPARGRRRQVFYDAGCGVCFHVVRVLARLDVHRRLTWISNQDAAALPAGVEPALLEKTILVVDPETGRRWTRSDGFAQMFAALPLGRLWAWPLLVPGLRALAGRAYDAFARNRTTISMWLGLAACAIPGSPSGGGLRPPESSAGGVGDPLRVPMTMKAPPLAPKPAPEPTLLRAWWRTRLPVLRELGVAFVLFLMAAELSVANAAIPQALRWNKRPDWMTYLVMYPHIFQGWSVFAPDAPLSDSMVVIDAVTRDGRHVDPLAEIGSRVATLPVDDIPPRLGQSALLSEYALHIPEAGSYHQALLEWILRYRERTGGGTRDDILSFQVWQVEHASPAPGETAPRDVKRRLFLQWPQPPGGR